MSFRGTAVSRASAPGGHGEADIVAQFWQLSVYCRN